MPGLFGKNFLAPDEAPPKTTGPNPAMKKSLAQLSESYNCRICNKKILAPYTLDKNSAPVCCEKNIPAQGKIPPPLLI